MTTRTDTPADAVVRDLAASWFSQLEQAWNRADGDAFGKLFADDADFVDIRGDHHQGSVAIGRGHQAIFDTIYAGSTVGYQVESVRPVAEGTVVVVATATLDAPSGPLRGVNRSRI